jgi:hypothetical protein
MAWLPGITGLSASCYGTLEARNPFGPRFELHGDEGLTSVKKEVRNFDKKSFATIICLTQSD